MLSNVFVCEKYATTMVHYRTNYKMRDEYLRKRFEIWKHKLKVMLAICANVFLSLDQG